MIYNTGLCLLLLLHVEAAFEGDKCTKEGVSGQCVNIQKCQPALDDLKRKKYPQVCGFLGTDPLVCCVDSRPSTATTSPRPVLTTSTSRTKTTTEYIPPVYDYKDTNGNRQDDCVPIASTMTSPKTGQRAFDKCIDYQEKYVYPCVKSVDFLENKVRALRCLHKADGLIIGGEDADVNEFPHMVLLGYGDAPESASWLCGGSIISERFVLTAGHCTSARNTGPVSYVRIKTLKRSERLDLNNVYELERIIKHPSYKSPMKYNDIALLKTKTEMKLDQFSVPACLHVGDMVKDDEVLATGWGLTTNRGQTSDVLQKVILNKFTAEECDDAYPVTRNMERGFDSGTQMCYGDKKNKKDTCQGDSGGPLQIKSKRVHCMYVIVGVTSFGKECGFPEQPGMYTRVPPFVQWIESQVWPN